MPGELEKPETADKVGVRASEPEKTDEPIQKAR